MSRKPLQAQRVTLTATATAMVTQQQRQNQLQRPSAGTRHKATDTMSTTAWTHTQTPLDTHAHTNTLFWKHTRTNLGTHTDTCETATWRRNIHLGVHRSARHVRSIHFFPHWVKIEKKTRFLSFSGPNQNPNNKVLDISRTKLPAVIMSFAKPPAAVGTIMTSGHDKQVPARLPPLITAKESTGIIHLLVELA